MGLSYRDRFPKPCDVWKNGGNTIESRSRSWPHAKQEERNETHTGRSHGRGHRRIRMDRPGPGHQTHQRRAEPVSNRQGLLQVARGADVGIDERRRHRQGRQIDLGRRALRRQHLPRSRDRQDVGPADRPQVRRVRQAREELRRRAADFSARHLRRQRRQRLGDRRTGQRAGARRAARRAARRRGRRRTRAAPSGRSVRGPARRTAIRCSSSARTASC